MQDSVDPNYIRHEHLLSAVYLPRCQKTLCKLPEAVFLAIKFMNHFYDQQGKISKWHFTVDED